jgi:hypothetical protein
MKDLILDTNRLLSITGAAPTDLYYDPNNHPGSTDLLADSEPGKSYSTDQTGLSYSFDFKGNHFAIINTDSTGVDGRAPAKWLAADFAAAKARAATAGTSVPNFFVFGHKPAYTYKYLDYAQNPPVAITKLSGLDNTQVTIGGVKKAYNRDEFWNVIEYYKATYFSGHEHIFNIQQPKGVGGAYQVLVGSGGSPFDSVVAPATSTDRTYAWAEVRVYQSGKVQLTAYGFDDNYGPTTMLQNFWLH